MSNHMEKKEILDDYVNIDIWDSLENYRLLEKDRGVTIIDVDAANIIMFVITTIKNESGTPSNSMSIPKDMAEECPWMEIVEEEIFLS